MKCRHFIMVFHKYQIAEKKKKTLGKTEWKKSVVEVNYMKKSNRKYVTENF